jgi:hypothetical protein
MYHYLQCQVNRYTSASNVEPVFSDYGSLPAVSQVAKLKLPVCVAEYSPVSAVDITDVQSYNSIPPNPLLVYCFMKQTNRLMCSYVLSSAVQPLACCTTHREYYVTTDGLAAQKT